MSRDPLEREYGVILTAIGPGLMEKAYWYRQMAKLIEDTVGEASPTVGYLRMQADRSEEAIINLARRHDARR